MNFTILRNFEYRRFAETNRTKFNNIVISRGIFIKRENFCKIYRQRIANLKTLFS